jgi:hypothetical protein
LHIGRGLGGRFFLCVKGQEMVAASPLEAAKKAQIGHKLDVGVEEEEYSPAQKTVFSAIFRARKKCLIIKSAAGEMEKECAAAKLGHLETGVRFHPQSLI